MSECLHYIRWHYNRYALYVVPKISSCGAAARILMPDGLGAKSTTFVPQIAYTWSRGSLLSLLYLNVPCSAAYVLLSSVVEIRYRIEQWQCYQPINADSDMPIIMHLSLKCKICQSVERFDKEARPLNNLFGSFILIIHSFILRLSEQ